MIYDVIDGILRIPEGDEYILEESYAQRDDIRQVYLPSTMKVIGPVAFMECQGLTDVFVNNGLTEIGAGAFLGCRLLSLISLPDTLDTICPMAFWESGLSEISVPQNVKSIGESAFWNNAGLRSVDILGQDTIIERDAFGDCPKLVKGFIAPGFPAYDDAPSELLYSLLLASTYDKHDKKAQLRAADFIKNNQMLVMEHILRSDNIFALSGILKNEMLDIDVLDYGLKEAVKDNLTELSSMILKAKSEKNKTAGMDEFEL